MESAAKTARFSSVVDKCGQPEPAVLWGPPEQDPAFQKAMRQHRIMTVRAVAKKKDYGVVGYDSHDLVSLLVFPKSLKQFEGFKIVGIDYSKVRQPSASAEASAAKASKTPITAKQSPRGKTLQLHGTAGEQQFDTFLVEIRFTATLDKTIEVEAESPRQARENAEELAREGSVDFGAATVSSRLLRVSRK